MDFANTAINQYATDDSTKTHMNKTTAGRRFCRDGRDFPFLGAAM